MLRVVPVKSAWYCFPWRLRDWDGGCVHGGRCCYCEREIAVPDHKRGHHVACIYCGLDRGELPETEAAAYGDGVPISRGVVFQP